MLEGGKAGIAEGADDDAEASGLMFFADLDDLGSGRMQLFGGHDHRWVPHGRGDCHGHAS
ncbi:hypothetical protein D3C78_1950210 [compost metagenome]